jgi:hypothetical protein
VCNRRRGETPRRVLAMARPFRVVAPSKRISLMEAHGNQTDRTTVKIDRERGGDGCLRRRTGALFSNRGPTRPQEPVGAPAKRIWGPGRFRTRPWRGPPPSPRQARGSAQARPRR